MAIADEGMLRLAISGDAAALCSLLVKHGPDVRGRIAREIPHRWQSVLSDDDILQQTYADAMRDIRKFKLDDRSSFAAWLLIIAKHNLLDAIKMLEADSRGGNQRRIEPAGSDESFIALYDMLSASSTTPSRLAARNEIKNAIQQAVGKLPDAYRQVVSMYDIEGRSVQEVADALGRSCGAVFMLRARAHARLREEMETASKYLSGSA